MLAARTVDFPDRGAALFCLQAVFADVAVGAYADIQLAAILAGHHVFGPVMVQRAAGQIDDRGAGRFDRSFTRLIGEAQQLVRVGHIQVVADQGHAKRRIEVFQEHRAGLGDTVVVGVTQQRDAVRTRHAGTGPAHDLLHDPAANAPGVIGLGWRVGFRDQHIAVGQHIQPAGMVQALGERRHLGTGGGRWLHAVRPADGGGDVHGGDQRLVRLR